MACREFAVFLHHLQSERRRRQRESRAREQGRLPAGPEEYKRDEAQRHGRQNKLRGAEPKDSLAHCPQPFRPELEFDQKKQQDDTELGEMQNLLGIALGEQGSDAKGSKQHAGYQVAENGGYPEPARQRPCQRQGRQKYGQFVEIAQSPFLSWAAITLH